MKNRLVRPAPEKCAEILERLRHGSSLAAEAEILRKCDITNYAKAQVMYTLIVWSLCAADMPTNLAFSFILDWRREVLLHGLYDNVSIPDDGKMRKIFSRPSRTQSRQWEAQGHTHKTDGLPLLERVYAVHEQITGK